MMRPISKTSVNLDRRRALESLGAAGIALIGSPLAHGSLNQAADDQISDLPRSFSEKSREKLLALLNAPGFSGRIEGDEVRKLASSERRTVDGLMIDLLPIAARYSRAPISMFHVGAVVRGVTDALYLGANIEIRGQALGLTVHAEQSALSNAYMHGEQAVSSIAVTAAPCGQCRQFLTEFSPEGNIRVLIAGKLPATISSLLPLAFGPKDLGFKQGALPVKEVDLSLPMEMSDEVIVSALSAGRRSYAPYTKAYSGISIQTSQGRIYKGSYIENAAFNPSLPPFQTALAALVLGGESDPKISKAVLVEVEGALISQRYITQDILGALSPSTDFSVVKATLKP
jgi:cytidine deaminase